MDWLQAPHGFWTTITAACWFVIAAVSALASIYGGPSHDAYHNVVDSRRWWRRGFTFILCFACCARGLMVLERRAETWDSIVIAVVFAIFAVFYWRRYINERRSPDARDE